MAAINIEQEKANAQEIIKAQGLRVLVCAGTGCVASGALEVIEELKKLEVNAEVMTEHDKMTTVPTGCHGFCEQGVLIVIPDLHVTYVQVKPEDCAEIVESHIKNGKIVERLLYTDPRTNEHIFRNEDILLGHTQTARQIRVTF